MKLRGKHYQEKQFDSEVNSDKDLEQTQVDSALNMSLEETMEINSEDQATIPDRSLPRSLEDETKKERSAIKKKTRWQVNQAICSTRETFNNNFLLSKEDFLILFETKFESEIKPLLSDPRSLTFSRIADDSLDPINFLIEVEELSSEVLISDYLTELILRNINNGQLEGMMGEISESDLALRMPRNYKKMNSAIKMKGFFKEKCYKFILTFRAEKKDLGFKERILKILGVSQFQDFTMDSIAIIWER